MGFRIWLSPPHVGDDERELLLDAFDSNWIAPLGPHVDAFEKELAATIGSAHAVALSSGTAALHLALLLSGIGRGDRVATSTLTFAASAFALRYVGAEPVFIDADAATWNLDPELLADELARAESAGAPLAAILPVDLYGQCADYDAIVPLAQERGIPVIEDAAEAVGATRDGRHAGTFGDLGVLSFNGNKIITTSGGGALVTDDEDVAQRARQLATQAREPAPHYEHAEVGFNYRLSNLLAAVGRGQLRHLEDRVARRRAINARYRELLGDTASLDFMPLLEDSNAWLTCITIDPEVAGTDREHLRTHLVARGIEARPVWKPMHLQPVFADCRVRGGEVAAGLFERGLCLPSGSALTDAEVEEVAGEVASALASK
ncbi:MAG: aminotransferase class I/II-fold pyridoxal phosphate-dependent enzyme [Actinobacteria bacterium]|nr:aminotransferase class I/II-fold pyridoxal phosphate-dependent enzyme [Actinomycetota bacterium]